MLSNAKKIIGNEKRSYLEAILKFWRTFLLLAQQAGFANIFVW